MNKRVLYILLFLLLTSQFYFFIKDDYLDRIYLAFSTEKKTPHPLPSYWMSRNEVFNNTGIDSNSVVFIGDSQTQLFELNDYFINSHFYNRGILGDDILGLKERLSEIVARKPKTIYLMIGVNDVLNGKSQTQINKDFLTLTNYLASHSYQTNIVFQSILPIGENRYLTALENYQTNFKALNLTINKTNDFLKKQCAKHHYQYINLHSFFYKNNDILDSLYLKDGIHLSNKGYALWAKKITL